MAKQLNCPRCEFSVKSASESEVLQHAMMHTNVYHPEMKATEQRLREMVITV